MCDTVHLFNCATHFRVEFAVSDKQNAQTYRDTIQDTILDAVAELYCSLFYCSTAEDSQTRLFKECCKPFLVRGLAYCSYKTEANHIALLRVEDDDPETVHCQEAYANLFYGQKLFQTVKHYVSVTS